MYTFNIRLSDAGGPLFESQTGRVRGKSTPSLNNSSNATNNTNNNSSNHSNTNDTNANTTNSNDNTTNNNTTTITTTHDNLWRDKHPAVKGLRTPEHHSGKSPLDQENELRVSLSLSLSLCVYIYIYTDR